MRLTDIAVRQLPTPERGQKLYTDDTLPGFGVRVSQGGTRTFVLVHGERREKLTIGRYPIITLSEARTEAKRILAEKTLGKRQAPSASFDSVKEKYLAACEAKNRPGTVREYTRLLTHFPFGNQKLADIRRHDVSAKLGKIASLSEASHALTALKAFMTWCVRQGHIENSPCEALQAPQRGRSRERALDQAELREVLSKAKAEGFPFGQIVQLLILTGQRRGEIAALQWDWIDEEARTITLPDILTKNKRTQVLPYGDMTQAIFDELPRMSPYLFPAQREQKKGKPATYSSGFSKAKARFDKTLENVKPWTLHDLRRTLSTGMASIGVPQIAVEKLLNHVSGGTQSPIAQVYNRHSYLKEMREAVEAWEQHLHKLLQST